MEPLCAAAVSHCQIGGTRMEFTSRAGGLRFIVSMCLAASFCRKKQREQGTRKAKYPENDNKFLACARDNKSSGSADGLFFTKLPLSALALGGGLLYDI